MASKISTDDDDLEQFLYGRSFGWYYRRTFCALAIIGVLLNLLNPSLMLENQVLGAVLTVLFSVFVAVPAAMLWRLGVTFCRWLRSQW